VLSFSRYTSGQQRDYLEKLITQASPAVYVDAKAYGAVRGSLLLPPSCVYFEVETTPLRLACGLCSSPHYAELLPRKFLVSITK